MLPEKLPGKSLAIIDSKDAHDLFINLAKQLDA